MEDNLLPSKRHKEAEEESTTCDKVQYDNELIAKRYQAIMRELSERMDDHLSKFATQLQTKLTEVNSQVADQINELHMRSEANRTLKRKIDTIKAQTASLNKTINS